MVFLIEVETVSEKEKRKSLTEQLVALMSGQLWGWWATRMTRQLSLGSEPVTVLSSRPLAICTLLSQKALNSLCFHPAWNTNGL